MNKDNFAVLMAGGVGSRFWPVSTAGKPKQFRDLLGTGETLIQTTFRRLRKLVPTENILVLTNERYSPLVNDQLPEVGSGQIVLEPAMRNTAPAVLLAALKIWKRNPEAVMVMAPSDHWIENEEAFARNIGQAFEACRQEEKIITLGIKPTFPNTGYGYIQFKEQLGEIYPVQAFTEKPDYQKAREFLAKGTYLWNAGIFVWNASFIIDSFKRNLPEMYRLFWEGNEVYNTAEEAGFISANYSKAQDISIDYGILEKEKKVFVIPAGFDWNDLGTWGSLYDQKEKDASNNVVLNALVSAKEATGNIVSAKKGKVVVIEDLKDFIIIDEEEILMIVPKKKEQEIKMIRARVMEKFGEDLG